MICYITSFKECYIYFLSVPTITQFASIILDEGDGSV